MCLKVDRQKSISLFLEFLDGILIDYKESVDVYEPSEIISEKASIKCVHQIFRDRVKFWQPLNDISH